MRIRADLAILSDLDGTLIDSTASTVAAYRWWAELRALVRTAAMSQANIRLAGSHAGVEIGADGPSQMGLEDLAMLRAVHGSTVLYPSDAASTAALVAAMAEREGVVYLRTTRGAYPVLYEPSEQFPIGGSKLLRASSDDQVTLIGAGVARTSAWQPPRRLSRKASARG